MVDARQLILSVVADRKWEPDDDFAALDEVSSTLSIWRYELLDDPDQIFRFVVCD